MDIVEEIKRTFKNGSVLSKLLYVNLGLFVLVRLLGVVLFFAGNPFDIVQWLGVPTYFTDLKFAPWTLVTYMFTHWKFTHILFNMLMLYWFGKIFLQYHSEKKMLGLYVMGGIVGAVMYLLAFNLIPVFKEMGPNYMIGASASVVAIIIASAVYAPNYVIHLFLIGPVKIVWIALVSVFFYVIGITSFKAGGEIAHLGGALWGYIFMTQLKKGNYITERFDNFIFNLGSVFKRKSNMKVAFRNKNVRNMSDREFNLQKKAEKENINHILDKISKSGYESLSKSEKEILFKMSNNKKGKPN